MGVPLGPPRGEKWTFAISLETLPKVNTICAYTMRPWNKSLGAIGHVVVENKVFPFWGPHGGPMGAPCLGGPKGRPKSTSSVSTKTLPKLDTICAYTMRIYCESLEEIGLVVVEKECFPSWGSPWGPQGEPPHGEKNKLLQLWPKHSQNLIPYADTLCASSIKVWRQLDQCLLRKLMFSSVALFL